MREVLDEIRRRMVAPEERGALFAALLMMADVDPWGHNLKEEIKTMTLAEDPEIFKLYPTLREAFEEGELKGEQKGELKLLRQIFAKQVGHTPTPDEQEALAKRARELGPEEAVMAVVKLRGDALAAWLLGTGTPERTG